MASSSQFRSYVDRIETLAQKKGVTIHLDLDETSSLAQIDSFYSYEPKGKILSINVPKLSKVNKELLFKVIRKIHSQDGLLWKESKEAALESYSEYRKSNSDTETLEFFAAILPQDDYSALKMSMFLRAESKKGKNIRQYKSDIRDKFGDRGGNIANLCSAGYFETEIKPLYLTAPKTEFFEYYEMVVGQKARALFIHSGMGESHIENEVYSMVDKAIKYHMNDFRVHAMGKQNVEVVNRFFKSRKEDEDNFVIEKIYEDPKIPAIEYIVKISRD